MNALPSFINITYIYVYSKYIQSMLILIKQYKELNTILEDDYVRNNQTINYVTLNFETTLYV